MDLLGQISQIQVFIAGSGIRTHNIKALLATGELFLFNGALKGRLEHFDELCQS
jgi:hypothetical protein